MTEDRDKEPKSSVGEEAQPDKDATSVTGGAATKSAAEKVISPVRFDPNKMKHDMEVFMTSREDEEKVKELATLYAGVGEVANRTADFDPDFKLPPEGKAKLAEAMNQLGDVFFTELMEHYNELESLVDKFLHELKTKGVFFIAQSTPDHYRYNQQFREGLLKIMEKMREGVWQLSHKKLDELSDKYKNTKVDEGFPNPRKAEFRKATGLNHEDKADTMIEICKLRAFLKQLEAPLKENLQDEMLADVQNTFSKYFNEEDRNTADFLAAIIKRILEHQSNSIAGQTASIIQSDENMSFTFDNEDQDGNLIDNPEGKLKFMLARTVQVLRVMRLVKYQKTLFRLGKEV